MNINITVSGGEFHVRLETGETLARTLLSALLRKPEFTVLASDGEEETGWAVFEGSASTLAFGIGELSTLDGDLFWGIQFSGFVSIEGDDTLDGTKDPKELGLDDLIGIAGTVRSLFRSASVPLLALRLV